MITPTASTSASDLHAAAIADASGRLAYLQRLADLGMRLAEEIVERAINSPYHPEPVHEPARAFATVSRAVRLTLVLQERMEAKLIALRNGVAPIVEESGVARLTSEKRVKAPDATLDDVLDDAPETTDRSRETLREYESERFDELVSGPFDTCVAAIRADLGLAPDGDIPSDEAGVEVALGKVREMAASALQPGNAPASSMPTAVEAPHPTDSG